MLLCVIWHLALVEYIVLELFKVKMCPFEKVLWTWGYINYSLERLKANNTVKPLQLHRKYLLHFSGAN